MRKIDPFEARAIRWLDFAKADPTVWRPYISEALIPHGINPEMAEWPPHYHRLWDHRFVVRRVGGHGQYAIITEPYPSALDLPRLDDLLGEALEKFGVEISRLPSKGFWHPTCLSFCWRIIEADRLPLPMFDSLSSRVGPLWRPQ